MLNSAWAEKTQFDLPVTSISKNVFSIISPSHGRPTPENKGWNANSHFIVTDEGVLVFDSGSSEIIGTAIIAAIKTVTDKPVRWVVNSHSHADHWLGNAAFINTGAEIISTKTSLKIMKQHGKEDVAAFYRMTEGATGVSRIKYPTVLLDQSAKRNFANINVEFIFSNDAHSPGDILMWLPEQKIIFGGDVLSSVRMPILTYHGNVPHLIETLHGVEKLNPTIVLPGHGTATTAKSISRDAKLLVAVSELVQMGLEMGESSDQILTKVIASLSTKYRGLYEDFDSNIEYLVKTVYKEKLTKVGS
jgi:glyoxylase-like metal-dependent hydrolase (beta-lactamase superfamily II)